MSEWQPIETAPKDGTLILVAGPVIDSSDVAGYVPWKETYVVLAWWEGSCWLGCFGDYHDTGCPICGGWFEYPVVWPTHWMPLPEPPK